MVMRFYAAALVGMLLACNSTMPQVVPSATTGRQPQFAEGEATQVLLRYLRTRSSCGMALQRVPLRPLPYLLDYVRYWDYGRAIFTEEYEGSGSWLVSTSAPEYRASVEVFRDAGPASVPTPTESEYSQLRIGDGRRALRGEETLLVDEERVLRKAIPDASWRVFETTGIVVALNVPLGCY